MVIKKLGTASEHWLDEDLSLPSSWGKKGYVCDLKVHEAWVGGRRGGGESGRGLFTTNIISPSICQAFYLELICSGTARTVQSQGRGRFSGTRPGSPSPSCSLQPAGAGPMQWARGWRSSLSRPLGLQVVLQTLTWGECPAWESLLNKVPELTLSCHSDCISSLSSFLL